MKVEVTQVIHRYGSNLFLKDGVYNKGSERSDINDALPSTDEYEFIILEKPSPCVLSEDV